MTWEVRQGDCVEAMRAMPEASVDAVVCDPPYELGFMGCAWDRSGVAYRPETWEAVLRVLKPGGHLLAFGGTRTSHRLACAIEDAGFEIRDTICWLYGSGFPKSLNVSKAIDKAAGADGTYGAPKSAAHAGWIERGRMRGEEGHDGYQRPWMKDGEAVDRNARQYEAATPEAEQWEGWGTALKPAHEQVVVARKPLTGTVAQNVLAHGTGALNVDGCRIAGVKPVMERTDTVVAAKSMAGESTGATATGEMTTEGRWPANVVLNEEAGAMLDEQAGSGGASRFFYCAKASSAERNAGLDGFEERATPKLSGGDFLPVQADGGPSYTTQADRRARNVHPTVKPIALMRWLVRLVTPPGGMVLDPFTGSGTTGCAAALESLGFIGVEREAEYAAIARARIAWWARHRGEGDVDEILAAGVKRDAVSAQGQSSIFDALDDAA